MRSKRQSAAFSAIAATISAGVKLGPESTETCVFCRSVRNLTWLPPMSTTRMPMSGGYPEARGMRYGAWHADEHRLAQHRPTGAAGAGRHVVDLQASSR